jgi:hypothetical protein
MTTGLMPLEDLYALAARIRHAERAGVLVQLDGFGAADTIAPDKPLPQDDTVFRYRCEQCRAQFSLRCNTYYGRGGSWGPVRVTGFPSRPVALAS